MAKHRSKKSSARRGGMFDPDYRRKGWNQSRYAPRHGGLSMTQLSLLITMFLSAPFVYLAYAFKQVNLQNIFIFLIAFFVVAGIVASFIRKREWARIQRNLQEDDTAVEPNATRRRQTNKSLDLNNLTPTDFEHEVAWLINTLSRFKAVVVGGSGDNGIDIELYQGGALVGIVQCKYYDAKTTLSPNHVRELAGAKQAVNARIAYLFTTSRCSKKTYDSAEKLGIKVFDGDKIQQMREQAKARTATV